MQHEGLKLTGVRHLSTARPDHVVIGLLTGGQSTRMGRDKATTPLAGRTMAERVASACAATGLETVVLGPDDAGTGLEFVPDDDALPRGPLGGLITLLRKRPGAHVLLVATDQPFVRSETLRALADLPPCGVAVPIDDEGWPQVTCARYGPEVLEAYEHRHDSDDGVWRLRSLLDRIDTVRVHPDAWRAWGDDGRSFRSIDRPEDLESALAELGDT